MWGDMRPTVRLKAEGVKVVPAGDVLTVKRDGRKKTRTVMRGYLMEAGVHYNQTFAPVVQLTTLRVLLALATKLDWEVKQGTPGSEISRLEVKFLVWEVHRKVPPKARGGFVVVPHGREMSPVFFAPGLSTWNRLYGHRNDLPPPGGALPDRHNRPKKSHPKSARGWSQAPPGVWTWVRVAPGVRGRPFSYPVRPPPGSSKGLPLRYLQPEWS
jgi:hypothetical protein